MNKPKSKKSTREEAEQRTETCFKLLLSGTSKADIQVYACKLWGITQQQAWNYADRAYQQIRNSKSVDRDYEIARELLRRDVLYQKALREEGVRSALAVCDSRCELLGLFAPQKVELVDNRVNPYAHLNKEESIAALAELETLKTRTGPKLVPTPKDQGKRRTG